MEKLERLANIRTNRRGEPSNNMKSKRPTTLANSILSKQKFLSKNNAQQSSTRNSPSKLDSPKNKELVKTSSKLPSSKIEENAQKMKKPIRNIQQRSSTSPSKASAQKVLTKKIISAKSSSPSKIDTKKLVKKLSIVSPSKIPMKKLMKKISKSSSQLKIKKPIKKVPKFPMKKSIKKVPKSSSKIDKSKKASHPPTTSKIINNSIKKPPNQPSPTIFSPKSDTIPPKNPNQQASITSPLNPLPEDLPVFIMELPAVEHKYKCPNCSYDTFKRPNFIQHQKSIHSRAYEILYQCMGCHIRYKELRDCVFHNSNCSKIGTTVDLQADNDKRNSRLKRANDTDSLQSTSKSRKLTSEPPKRNPTISSLASSMFSSNIQKTNWEVLFFTELGRALVNNPNSAEHLVKVVPIIQKITKEVVTQVQMSNQQNVR